MRWGVGAGGKSNSLFRMRFEDLIDVEQLLSFCFPSPPSPKEEWRARYSGFRRSDIPNLFLRFTDEVSLLCYLLT